ncbi:MAG: radical SAM protein [Elusimicrobia bacterium]|nr:radical SAM protein [Elusimicrobiota bacterium]
MSEKQNLKCYELILNYNCNARCMFCSQGSFDKSLNADFKLAAENIYGAYKSGYRRLGLTGGEPLIRPDILKVIALAKSVGFDFIRVQTNGIKLADPAFCRRLVNAGLTFCKFSLTSDKPAEHDRLLGVPGAYKSAVRGVKNLRKLKIRLGNNILVNALNYNRLPEIIRSFLDLGITNFVVIYPVYIGGMAEHSDGLGVSLGECKKYFAEAAELMKKMGLEREILFLNVPPCFLRGRESLAIGLDLFNTVVTDPAGGKSDLDITANRAKVRAPACRNCRLRRRCAGVDAHYAEIFGLEDFTAAQPGGPRPFGLSLNPKGRGGPAFGGKPVIKRRSVPVPKREKPRVFFSDNELCLIEILKIESHASTATVLKLAKNIVLCRDCSDGNSVLNAAQSLEQKGLVESVFERGRYYWRLKTKERVL